MDGMVLFFASATYEDVERAAQQYGFSEGVVTGSGAHFYLRRYESSEIDSELGAEEIEMLKQTLGRYPSSAFVVEARHGGSARFALQAIAGLMSEHLPAVIDDDFGRIHAAETVVRLAKSKPEEGLYALRS